jgi:excisionase family DNA binding protein
MKAIQLIDISPEELQTMISEGVKTCLENPSQTRQNPEYSDLLTREQTASLLKIDLSTLYNWTKKKTLTAYGIGSRVYYKHSEVEQALIKLN